MKGGVRAMGEVQDAPAWAGQHVVRMVVQI